MITTWSVNVTVGPTDKQFGVVKSRSVDQPLDALTPADEQRLQEICDLAFSQVQQWLALRAPTVWINLSLRAPN